MSPRDPNVIDLAERRQRERRPRITRAQLIKAALCALSGTLLFLSCAKFDIWPLAWFGLVPLIGVAMHPTTRRPAAYGFIGGLFANGGGFYWFAPFLERFGQLPRVAAIPIFLLLIAYQALTFALFAWALRRLCDRLGGGTTFYAPIVYVTLELCVPFIFPWYLAITQAWVRPAIQVADLTGPLGVSFLLVLCNGALYDAGAAWRQRQPLPLRRLALAVGILACAFGYGLTRIHQVEAARRAAPKLKVGVVQANIGVQEKWNPRFSIDQLLVHQRQSQALVRRGAELVIWPESSYPYFFRRDQSHDWPADDPKEVQRGFSTPLLFGSLTLGADSPYPYNSALLLDRDGDVRGRFDKNILMVFGEYIPFYDEFKFIKEWIPATSNFARGTDVTTFPLDTSHGTVRLGPMICYEDIFPSFGRRLTLRKPNLLVNITNDAWFGRTAEPYQHLALSVFRAVEARLDLVRAVNTGVSAFVDATGRVYDHTESVDPDQVPSPPPTSLLDEVAVLQPFTLYAHLGEWFGGLCLLLTVWLGLKARARGGHPVRWRLVLIGVAALAGGTLALALLFCGPSHLGLAARLIAYRPLAEVDPSLRFSVGLRLIAAAALACLSAGALVAHRGRKADRPRLEAVLAILAVLVVPPVLIGSLEGEQTGLVLSTLGAVGLALFAGWLYRRLRRNP